MGVLLFQKASSYTADLVAPDTTMSITSNSSSMEARNGSAYSESGRSPRANTGSSQSRRARQAHRSRHSRTHRDNMNRSGGRVDRGGSRVSEADYESTTMSQTANQSLEAPSDSYYHGSQDYYSSPLFHTPETTMYDDELRLDEEQTQTTATPDQQYSSFPGGDYYSQQTHTQYTYPQTPAQGSYRPQTPVHNSNQNVPTSPSTVRWTVESSPEERIRLGLPRYATEEEIEEQRRIYEQATQQADYPESAPHAG